MALIKNFSYSTVAVAPSPATSGTSLTVSAGEGALFALDRPAVIYPSGLPPLSTNAEIVQVSGITGDVLTITRAQEGTSARTVIVGDQIAQTFTAGAANEIEAQLANVSPAAVAADVNPAGANIAAALALKQNVGSYATAAQGAKADTALQPNGSAANLTNFPTLNQNTTGRAAFADIATIAQDANPAGSNLAAALANKQNTGAYLTSGGALGTPANGNLANCTSLPAGGHSFTAADKILGRSTAGAGVGEEITCTSAGRALLDDTDAAAQRDTLGVGTRYAFSNIRTANYTPVLADAGTWQRFDNTSLVYATIDRQSNVAWPTDCEMFYEQRGAGQLIVVAGTNVTINVETGFSAKTRAQYATIGLKRVSEDVWTSFGAMAAA